MRNSHTRILLIAIAALAMAVFPFPLPSRMPSGPMPSAQAILVTSLEATLLDLKETKPIANLTAISKQTTSTYRFTKCTSLWSTSISTTTWQH